MTEPHAEALRASYDAVLDELEGAADIGRGLADLRARLKGRQPKADPHRVTDIQVRIADLQARLAAAEAGHDIRYFTVAEAALIMRASKMTVYRLIDSGELEAIRVGRSFRIPKRALRSYLGDESAKQR